MPEEISGNIATQKDVAGFVWTADDLADTVKSLFTFGSNILESLSKSKGALNAIYVKSPVTNEAYIAGTYRSAPELGEAPFRERLLLAAANYMEKVFRGDCRQTLFLKLDPCGRPDDMNTWNSGFLLESMRLNDISIEAPQTFDESAVVEMTGTFSLITWNRILQIRFTVEADTTVVAEIVDIIYADQLSCGACARFSDGCEAIFALARANSGSPGLSSQLLYRVTDGGEYTSDDIDALGGLSGIALAAVGRYLVVLSETAGKHVYAIKPTKAGQNLVWSSVSSGYQAGGSPRTIYAKSPSEVFIGGQGGYLYKADDILASVRVVHDASLTTQNFNIIHGAGQVVVAAGNNDTILLSINNGESFGLPDATPETGVVIRALWVLSAFQAYIGNDSGKLFFTDDQFATYTQRPLPDQSDISAILDIKFSPDSQEVGYVSVQMNDNTGRIYRTITGGRSWYKDSPGIDGLQSNERMNKLAVCGLNAVASGGKKVGSSDGLIVVAKS